MSSRPQRIFSLYFVLQFITVFRSSHRNCTVKKCYWKFEKFHKKIPVLEFIFNKVAGLRACNFNEKDSNAGFSCKIFKNFKNNNLEEHLRTTIPVPLRKISPLLVWGKPMLDGRWHNWATITFYWKYEQVWTSWS